MFMENKPSAYSLAIAFFVLTILLGVSLGSVYVPIPTILEVLGHAWFGIPAQFEPMYESIIINIRLPRVLLAGLVGASLAIAGAAFQGLLKNPLADPYTLGVSSGASLGAVLVLFFGITIPGFSTFTLPLVSIIFGFITILSVLFFARTVNRNLSVETIILTGIIFSSFLGSLISLLIALTGDELRQIIGWLLGSVSMRGWEYIKLFLPFFVIGTAILWMNERELNALSFGEEKAKYLGVNVARRKLFILLAGAMLTGAAVAVSGTIGFVGLVVPHFTRLLWGTNHKHLLPLSILTGASFLILADLVARTIITPSELPIGVITAIIGAPIFGLLLIRQRTERRGSYAKRL
ncbi:iron ABC transporter permease [Bacillus carboniphilus]|uniref:Iron ABC transporter permease n=1 Tax=Bacillus carboniphilus TaxID=86663 RepID=A0ABN0W3N8_9BACI